jgi:LytS/YehU family sensor histidine kinase
MHFADDTFKYTTDYAPPVRGVHESLYQKGLSLEEKLSWLRRYKRLESPRLGFPITFTADFSADINAKSYLVPGQQIQSVFETKIKPRIEVPKDKIRISATRLFGKVLEIAIFNPDKPWDEKEDNSESLGLKPNIDLLSLLGLDKAPENVLEVQLPEDGNSTNDLLKLPDNQNHV